MTVNELIDHLQLMKETHMIDGHDQIGNREVFVGSVPGAFVEVEAEKIYLDGEGDLIIDPFKEDE
ncbi:hypothetical protein ACTWKC_10045 [Bacillus sp. 4A_MP3]|uniref:hypothetical protein n=1 Tax=Bacillus velezensis TaxID=492670 RepID=UPI0015601A36|nr:hypothetical protein [Bacillus velezensis]NRF36694.1 hypothetical protein [Bacillus velezensis]